MLRADFAVEDLITGRSLRTERSPREGREGARLGVFWIARTADDLFFVRSLLPEISLVFAFSRDGFLFDFCTTRGSGLEGLSPLVFCENEGTAKRQKRTVDTTRRHKTECFFVSKFFTKALNQAKIEEKMVIPLLDKVNGCLGWVFCAVSLF